MRVASLLASGVDDDAIAGYLAATAYAAIAEPVSIDSMAPVVHEIAQLRDAARAIAPSDCA